MALDKATLKTDIASAFNDELDGAASQAQSEAIDRISSAIADAVDNYVRGITVTSTPVLSSPSGPVTGTITNTVS